MLDLAVVIGTPALVPPKCSDARVVPAGQWVRFDGAVAQLRVLARTSLDGYAIGELPSRFPTTELLLDAEAPTGS